MCIILYAESGKTIKDEWLDNSAKSNPDGFGLSYSSGDKVEIYKTMKYNKFKKKYRELESNFPHADFVLHFRKSTAGKTNVDNCHPFKVGDKAVFHNGVITKCDPPKDDKIRSDTRIFCDDILADLPPNWIEYESLLELIEGFIGGSKMVFMEPDGVVTILNEEAGHWVDGIWASNYSYYPNTKSIQKYKPYTWNSNIKLLGDSKQKAICYEHPDGYYTKYKNGIRYRWYPSMFMWSSIGSDGRIDPNNNISEYGDSPTSNNYRLIKAKYNLFSYKDVIEVKEEEIIACDWCDDPTPKSELGLFSWVNEPEEELCLVCKDCAQNLFGSEILQKAKNTNMEYYLQTRFANSIGDAV